MRTKHLKVPLLAHLHIYRSHLTEGHRIATWWHRRFHQSTWRPIYWPHSASSYSLSEKKINTHFKGSNKIYISLKTFQNRERTYYLYSDFNLIDLKT